MTQEITLAYSPDTDDAFMVYGIKAGIIASDRYRFTLISKDIQTLNEEALRGVYDITAISMAAYPSIANEYLMMPVGSSIGDQYGPAVVVHQSSPIIAPEMLEGKRIATPGAMTSAFFAAAGVFPEFIPVHMAFTDIEWAVSSGIVDAGILIHEPQLLGMHPHLRKIADLGLAWHHCYGLPLPLGANAIRRSLGISVIDELTKLYRMSIEYALCHRKVTLEKASAAAIAGLPMDLADRYIDQYVNDRSLDLHSDVRRGISQLFEIGASRGLCPRVTDTDYVC